MKKMKLKIFPKTFIGALSLIIGISVIAFILIGVLTPRFYRAYKEEVLNTNLNNLVSSLDKKEISEITRVLHQFAEAHEYGITMRDQNGNTLYSRVPGFSVTITTTLTQGEINFPWENDYTDNEYNLFTTRTIDGTAIFADAEESTLTLRLLSSMQPIHDTNTVLFRLLPYVLLISVALGAFVSFIYAKTITAPIKAISKATLGMRTLEKNAKCNVKSSDEIGELGKNINELYGRLLTTINDLQNEIHNVAAADKEKIDFMLTVSHELKTPLTAVKGMVEGMIYNVGVYKDRDKYLVRCGENIDSLTSLVNEILETSRLELSPTADDYIDTNIQELVKSTAATHEMIALSKQVSLNINIDENIKINLPHKLFSKALSNIISNAVRHNFEGGSVSIYIDNENLIIENTCKDTKEIQPGLGLYLTERILKVCGLSFDFVPFEKGMRFKIFLK